uniref:Myosin light chain kinase family member 4 n=1 Tax=Cynoglossus semilaevis TaxID=244447 RepID=A0A3P8VIX8_CYNSE
MRCKVKAMEKFVTGVDMWLTSGLCLVASYVWKLLRDFLSSKGRRTASDSPAFQKTTSNKTSKGSQQVTSACEPSSSQPSHRIQLHGPKHFLASRKFGRFTKDHKGKDGAEKPPLSPKSQKAQKRMKPPEADNISIKKQVLILQEVHKLNKENKEKPGQQFTPECLDLEAGVSPTDQPANDSPCNLVDFLREDSQVAENHVVVEKVGETASEVESAVTQKESKVEIEVAEMEEDEEKKTKVPEEKAEEESSPVEDSELPAAHDSVDEQTAARPDTSAAGGEQIVQISSTVTKSFKTEEHFVVGDHTGSQQEAMEKGQGEDNMGEKQKLENCVFSESAVEMQFKLEPSVDGEGKDNETEGEKDDIAAHFYIDTTPPAAAPFDHRIVSTKPNQISNFYTINWQEILGGGRFGQVHKCVENSSGLTLAVKVIKARSQKEKEVVKNEIHVMNNLDHANLIQLYAAYESRNDIILVLEYVSGGELFDRIIDENYTLMELDAVTFIRQICEGLQHMHKMYILHLDLKPENILCVSRVTNKIKIIDFGLARVYKPREKLRVNFGTPEFLAPEVINYDFVSFNTDMWSLGVITYMLLSGLSPFLGDDDNETLNNILACQWNFEEQEFADTSDQAKDFISRFLIVNKSWRMSAAEALRHPWLSDTALHRSLHTKKIMCRSRQSSAVPES